MLRCPPPLWPQHSGVTKQRKHHSDTFGDSKKGSSQGFTSGFAFFFCHMPFHIANQKGLKPLLCVPLFHLNLHWKKRKPSHIFHQYGGMQVWKVMCEHFHGSLLFCKRALFFGTDGFSHFGVNQCGHGRQKQKWENRIYHHVILFLMPRFSFLVAPIRIISHLVQTKRSFLLLLFFYPCLGYSKDFSLSFLGWAWYWSSLHPFILSS